MQSIQMCLQWHHKKCINILTGKNWHVYNNQLSSLLHELHVHIRDNNCFEFCNVRETIEKKYFRDSFIELSIIVEIQKTTPSICSQSL